jgi:phosphohistidine phosphatase
MKLYFLRHAEAEPGIIAHDHDRRLTSRGQRRTRTAARVMAALGVAPAHIFSSPRVRARQTAEIAADALNVPVELREEVNFGFDRDSVQALIAAIPASKDVMFVGHEPSFSMVIGQITGANVDMKKGGLARVDVERREPLRGVLVWLIAPKVFDVLVGP